MVYYLHEGYVGYLKLFLLDWISFTFVLQLSDETASLLLYITFVVCSLGIIKSLESVKILFFFFVSICEDFCPSISPHHQSAKISIINDQNVESNVVVVVYISLLFTLKNWLEMFNSKRRRRLYSCATLQSKMTCLCSYLQHLVTILCTVTVYYLNNWGWGFAQETNSHWTRISNSVFITIRAPTST